MIEALANIGGQQVHETLIHLLQSRKHIDSVIKALVKIANPQSLPYLKDRLMIQNHFHFNDVIEEIFHVQQQCGFYNYKLTN